ncbi:MAG: alpha/beta hydrolase [bacterium]
MTRIPDHCCRWLVAAVLLGVSAGSDGCGAGNDNQWDAAVDADAEAADAGPDAAPDGGTNHGVDWVTCSLDVNNPFGRLVECALIEVPLRHAEPEGPTIELWVQRVPASTEPKRGQIWFLQGGPGGSGADLGWMLDMVSEQAPSWDLLTTDHRGVGNSARLGCPVQEALGSESGFRITQSEWPACLQHVQGTWGDDLAEFTTTAAARDMGLLVDRLREPGLAVHLFGVSYGTYWLIRYLHLFPDQVDGVILDSIAPPGISLADYDGFTNDIGEDFLGYCAADTLCASHLGADPWATAGQIFDNAAQGSCPGYSALVDPGTERLYLRWALASLLLAEVLREGAPAVLHRLNRCDPDDVLALEHLLTQLWHDEQDVTASEALGSAVLASHIGLSELWSDPLPDASALAALQDGLYFSLGVSPRVAGTQDYWPFYPQDQYVGAWPDTDTPMLMGNGDLDPQTPPWVAQPAASHFTGPHQYYYELPRCAHGLIAQSPVNTPNTPPCFLQMILDFVNDPTAAPDAACLGDIEPIDFNGAHIYSQYLFGTDDLWENPPPSPVPPAVRNPPPGFRRALRWLRQNVPPPRFLRGR